VRGRSEFSFVHGARRPHSAKLNDMGMTFEAVYESGVIRPLETLALTNLQHVLVTISGTLATADD
jgi:hypothetical protein